MAFPGELNINYYKGDTHEFKVYPQKTDGSIFYLDDYSNATFTIAEVRGVAGLSGQIVGSARISLDGTNITCAITPENGKLMDPEKTYVYDVQVYAQGPDTYDKIFTILTGSISVTDDVTQDIGTPNRAIPTYRIIYNNRNATGGTTPTDTVTDKLGFIPNQVITVKGNENLLTREGYDFSGWTKFSDGTGDIYGPTPFPKTNIKIVDSDIKFYPKWTVNTITYDNQSATTDHSGGSVKYVTNSAIASIPTTPPIRTGHVFGGWFTGPAGSGTQVTNESYTVPAPYGPITLYAKWTVA
jgi:uncharacterized repeat protein (TIGR02543 family)